MDGFPCRWFSLPFVLYSCWYFIFHIKVFQMKLLSLEVSSRGQLDEAGFKSVEIETAQRTHIWRNFNLQSQSFCMGLMKTQITWEFRNHFTFNIMAGNNTEMARAVPTSGFYGDRMALIFFNVTHQQCLLTWSRKIKLFEPSEGIFIYNTKYWTTKKICKIGPLGPKEK